MILLYYSTELSNSPKYDYIIAGAGCAGLSLAVHMVQSGKFSNKKILLVDKAPKRENDRTWCFWQQEESLFESLVSKNWNRLWFYGEDFTSQLDIRPYQYKMIRGIDFYEHCFQVIRSNRNFDILFGNIQSVFSDTDTGIVIDGEKIFAGHVFNSILFENPKLNRNEYRLLQHFKGWVVETEEDCFDEKLATLMDFRISQEYGTSFCYVLPFNSKQALVEYTLFSESLLQQDEYDETLKNYLQAFLQINSYKVIEKEFGVIPMTNHGFAASQGDIINIGTAGGQTKGSSGYTFNFIQKHSKEIVDSIIATGKPIVKAKPKRFEFYDGVLLKVLTEGKVSGRKIFTELFKKNPTNRVLKFLDNETALSEEVKIISSLPTLPFLKAGISQLT